jgi:hypothetical protein
MVSPAKDKLINILLICTSLLGYLEWGGNNSMFLYQAIGDIFKKVFIAPTSVLHPFIVLPLIGLMILLYTLLQKKPGRLWTFIGIACIGLLLIFMFVAGVLSLNYKIIFSTMPFLAMATYAIFRNRKKTEPQ